MNADKDRSNGHSPLAMLNRAELEGLDLVDGPISVVGHRSPDTDSVCSAIICASLLSKLGFDARPALAEGINRETACVLEAAGVEAPEMLGDPAGRNIVLVDHSEYTQAAAGMSEAHIVAIVDHHNVGTVCTQNQVLCDIRPLGSTATILWLRHKAYEVEIDTTTACLMLGAILSDTKNLIAVTTTSADVAAVEELARIAGIPDTHAFYDRMSQARLSLEGMSDEEVYHKDYKEYEVAGTTYCIGCVDVYGHDDAQALVPRMIAHMQSYGSDLGMDLMFATVSALHDDISFTYLVPRDDVSREVAQRAFGDQTYFDGTSFLFEPHISRKRGIVPGLRIALDNQ